MFALFIVVGVFMVLNILIAVISDAYIDTKERLLCEPETMDFAAEGQHLLEEVRRDTDRDRQRQTETDRDRQRQSPPTFVVRL